MRAIVDDPSVGANFATLLIVRLDDEILVGGVFVFLPGNRGHEGRLIIEEKTDA